jgi:Na+/proline symporter
MLTIIDVLIFAAFLAYSIWSGLRSRSVAGQSLEEYFLAGRTLPGWKAGLSMAALLLRGASFRCGVCGSTPSHSSSWVCCSVLCGGAQG